METQVHADHLTGAAYLHAQTGARVGIGSNLTEVQEGFAAVFNVDSEFRCDGSQFDVLLSDGDRFRPDRWTAMRFIREAIHATAWFT